jgi:hypothetical protein
MARAIRIPGECAGSLEEHHKTLGAGAAAYDSGDAASVV